MTTVQDETLDALLPSTDNPWTVGEESHGFCSRVSEGMVKNMGPESVGSWPCLSVHIKSLCLNSQRGDGGMSVCDVKGDTLAVSVTGVMQGDVL